MNPGFANFDPIRRGRVLAGKASGPVAAPFSGVLLMPLYQKLGEDGFFIGRGDLTVALGAKSSADASVKDAVVRIIAAAKKADKPVCVMVASAAEAKDFAGLGASAFIISSDQGQMRRAAAQTLTDFKSLVPTTDDQHVSQH